MSEQPPVGSVAEEAARLVEAFARRASSTYDEQEPEPTYDEESRHATCAQCGAATDLPPEATPLACRVCPICQGVALLRQVRPETLERIAELATAVAHTLREVAAAGPPRAAGHGAAPDAPGANGRASVQRIPVEDLATDGSAEPDD